MTKLSFILAFFLLVACGARKNNGLSSNTQIQVCNIFNDTTNVELDGKVSILVFIKEPSCTGCKEYLAEYLNTLSMKYRQYIILGKSDNVLSKKSYNNYLALRFKKSSGTYYSLSGHNLVIKIDSKEYSFNTVKNPFVAVISNKGKAIDTYDYQEIFRNVFVKESFKKTIKNY